MCQPLAPHSRLTWPCPAELEDLLYCRPDPRYPYDCSPWREIPYVLSQSAFRSRESEHKAGRHTFQYTQSFAIWLFAVFHKHPLDNIADVVPIRAQVLIGNKWV
jgi:hypothetical protein